MCDSVAPSPPGDACVDSDRLRSVFRSHFRAQPEILVRAPGRVNLIGEHTDYNEGYVLPIAIDRAVWIAARSRDDQRVHLHALDEDQIIDFSLESFKRGPPGPAEYIMGVTWLLQEAGYRLSGMEGVILGDVPIGSGLSSSAALEIAAARSYAALSNLEWEPLTMARLAQRAENEWVGVQCGIMDQLISATGIFGHALLIDCRTLALEPAPLPSDTSIVIMDTGVHRELATSAYNDRRQACEEAARLLGLSALRDLNPKDFERRKDALTPVLEKRARHVIFENERTLQAHQAMLRNDAKTLGKLMRASHDSLRDDFEVSCSELDTIVNLANAYPACYGARMTGAGFGGCAVAVVQETAVSAFSVAVSQSYADETGIDPPIYLTGAAEGASLLESN
jgi:galactokinase